MRARSAFEQHVAVFGESGSGKTTLLSVFYGHQQAAAFSKEAGYTLLAKDTTQGFNLLRNYHLIEDGELPSPTRYRQTSFSFNIQPEEFRKTAGRLVWHDYPGEWWSETREGEEAKRKNETFRSLLNSDIALFLVDGKRLLEKKEHYLPRLFKSFRDELGRLCNNLDDEMLPFKNFPRVWIICLSKADLFSDKDVEWFRSEVLKKACEEVDELRQKIKSMVSKPDFISLGEEYLLLSSAKFNPDTGKVADHTETIGIDLLPPLSVAAPLMHAKKWANIDVEGRKIAVNLSEAFRGLTFAWMKWLPIVGRFFHLVDQQTKEGIDKLSVIQARAIKKGDSVEHVLAAFVARIHKPGVEKVYISRRL